MVQLARPAFDATFGALADPTRRGVLEYLARAEASITTLADRFGMTLPGMKKPVSILEHAGLVTTEKVGRVRTCRLGRRGLEDEAAWIARYHQLWSERFDALDTVVAELTHQEQTDGRQPQQ
jgi:DNA-binding transcriptional ArsR family regulator